MNNGKYLPLLFLSSLGASSCADKTEHYNVIYILADDLGYGDLGCYGQQLIRTPNIDRMASEGMLFTRHYSGSTVSAPSRSVLMTGLHTGHTPIRGNRGGTSIGQSEGQHPLPDSSYTLAEMFKDAGYVTGAFGKWGLGYPGSEGDPLMQGFDHFYGYNCQALAHKYYPDHLWDDGQKVSLGENDLIRKDVYSHDLIQNKALDFIRENKDGSFFAFLSYTLPHAELLVPEDEILASYRGRFEEKPYVANQGDYSVSSSHPFAYCSQSEPHAVFASMVTRLDMYVGQIMELLEELGISERTMLVFTSDNGPHHEGGADPEFFRSSGGLRGIKRDLYEGGIRVPMIARCPGVIPSGTTSDHISCFYDVLPTFAEMNGINLQDEVDGISFLPALKGEGVQLPHSCLYWEFHEQGGKMAVLKGDYKCIAFDVASGGEGVRYELYDLSEDPCESDDISGIHPDIVNEMSELMKKSRQPSPLFNFGQADGTM